MSSDLEALLGGTLESVMQLLDADNETHKPLLVESFVALAKATEEPIEFFYALCGLKTSPSLLAPLMQVNEWEWACKQVEQLPVETIVYTRLKQALDWSIVLYTTKGELGRLVVPPATATGTQIAGAVSIVQSALRHYGLLVFLDTEAAWLQYVGSLQSE